MSIIKTSTMIIMVAAVITMAACSSNNKTSRIPYVDYSSDYQLEGETIDIPFIVQSGVKVVTVKVNGLSTDMIFDTGCSQTTISMLEAKQLANRGLLSKDDYLGESKSIIADGTIVEDALYNIKTIELTDGLQKIICHDVKVQVSSNADAPVLLGNGVLDRVASYTIDNEDNVIRFKLK